jgi:hypothetical protein
MESTSSVTPKSIIKNYLLASELIDQISYEEFKSLINLSNSAGSVSNIEKSIKAYYLHYVQLKTKRRQLVENNIETEFLINSRASMGKFNASIGEKDKLSETKMNEVLSQLKAIDKYLDSEMRAARLEHNEVMKKFENIEGELSQINLSQPKEYEKDLLTNKWI